MKKRWISAVCALSLAAGLGTPAAAGYYEDTAEDHAAVDFSEMLPENYSMDSLYQAIDDLNAAVQVSGNREQASELLENMLDELDLAVTVSSIYDIAYYNDVTNEENSARSEEMTSALNDAYDLANAVVAAMLETEYEDLITDAIGDWAESFRGYELMTDEQSELLDQENDLVMEYDNLIMSDETDEDARYERIAEVYLQLLDVRKKEAEGHGYDSYMEYAYENTYCRDYSVEEAESYREIVKAYIVPLLGEMETYFYGLDSLDALYNLGVPTTEEILSAIGDHLSDIDPELQTAFDWLTEYHLYDIGASDTKMDMGYTTNLNAYGVPFIFISPYGYFQDYMDMIHEFGHFNQMFHKAGHALWDFSSIDVCEVHSQGLELLFTEYAADIYGEEAAEAAVMNVLYNILAVMADGCLFDEFQQKAFEAENLTVDGLTDLFIEVSGEYGYPESYYTIWEQVSHTFEDPFYYISYSTSAAAALRIYVDSLEDRAAAVDTYMKLTAVEYNAGFLEAMETVGMGNVLEEDSVAYIADQVRGLIEK